MAGSRGLGLRGLPRSLGGTWSLRKIGRAIAPAIGEWPGLAIVRRTVPAAGTVRVAEIVRATATGRRLCRGIIGWWRRGGGAAGGAGRWRFLSIAYFFGGLFLLHRGFLGIERARRLGGIALGLGGLVEGRAAWPAPLESSGAPPWVCCCRSFASFSAWLMRSASCCCFSAVEAALVRALAASSWALLSCDGLIGQRSLLVRQGPRLLGGFPDWLACGVLGPAPVACCSAWAALAS